MSSATTRCATSPTRSIPSSPPTAVSVSRADRASTTTTSSASLTSRTSSTRSPVSSPPIPLEARSRSRRGSADAVPHLTGVFGFAGAVSAAVEATLHFDAVADDLAATVLAHRRQPVGGTLEAVEDVMLPGGDDLERLVVLVPAHFARP